MRPHYLFAALAAVMTVLAPAAHAQLDYFEAAVYLTASPGPPWLFEGYSYIAYPYGEGPYPIATEATLGPGFLADSFCSSDDNGDYGSCDVGIGNVYADVELSVSEPGDYTVTGLYFWDEWLIDLWEQIGVLYGDIQVSLPEPTGEHSVGNSTVVTDFAVAGVFDMWILPAGTNFSGQTVRENAYLEDSCWYNGSMYDEVSGTGDSWWAVGNNNSYGDDNVGFTSQLGNAIYVLEYYQGALYHIPGCGFTGSQTMSMDGAGPYETHGVGIWIDPDHVTSYRGDGQIQIW